MGGFILTTENKEMKPVISFEENHSLSGGKLQLIDKYFLPSTRTTSPVRQIPSKIILCLVGNAFSSFSRCESIACLPHSETLAGLRFRSF